MSKKTEKKIKVKKKDTLKAFSILSGILFLLISVTSAFSSLIELVMGFYFARLTGRAVDILGLLVDGVAFFGIVMMLVLALVLFINKNSGAVFVPLGMLSIVFIDPIVNSVIDLFASMLWGWQYSTSLVDFISFFISFVIAAVITFFFTIAAFTFCKKCRQVLAFLMFALFLICSVVIGLLIVLTFVFYSNIITFSLANLDRAYVWVYLFKFLLAPIGTALLYDAQLFAVLLLAIGMCSKPRVITPAAVDEKKTEDDYGEGEPETVDASPVVVEVPAKKPKAEKAKAKKVKVEKVEKVEKKGVEVVVEQSDDELAALNSSMNTTLI